MTFLQLLFPASFSFSCLFKNCLYFILLLGFFSPVWGLKLVLHLLLGRAATKEHQKHPGLEKRRVVGTVFKSFTSKIQRVEHCWSLSAFHMLFHGHFSKLGGNTLKSRITFFLRPEGCGNWRSIGRKNSLIFVHVSISFPGISCIS